MTHGQFSDDARAYTITDPHTPRPWHNYLANEQYLANVTQHGTGASFWQPLGEGLRTNLTEDRDGAGGPRFVYLRDNESGDYWTISGAPGHEPMDDWACEVGLGYQAVRSRLHDIEASWTMFVPQVTVGNEQQADSCEIWRITLTNRSDRPRRISAFPFVEMHLTGGSTLMDFISVLGGHYDADLGAVFGINSCVKFPPKFKAVLASDAPVAAATVSRDAFIGFYRDYRNPIAVETGKVHNPQAGTEWLGASLKHDFELQPDESVSFNCLLGVIDSVADGKRLIETYLGEGTPQRVLDQIGSMSQTMCERMVVRTPDAQFDRWANVWLKHQLRFVARWGRVIGRGYRDVLQDTFAHRLTEPAKARQCLVEVFAKQFPNGKCIRAWRLPNAQLDLQHYADSPSWMIMALTMYLKETADFALLAEKAPFLNPDDPYAAPSSSASMWEHVVIAQRHLLQERGLHGLSLIHYGDWCDTMNGVGAPNDRGVSVMLSMQVKWGCDLLAELCEQLIANEQQRPAGVDEAQLAAVCDEMRAASDELTQAINDHAWDDAGYYIRAFDDEGVAVGSSNLPADENGELRIFLNPQSWSLIAEIAPPDRAASAVAAVYENLDTGYGMVLSYPQSTFLKPRIGQMSAMTPGFYENGSVYTHGNCFWSAALAMAGRGDEAWEAIRTVLPDTDNKPNTDTEPYVVPNMYIGPVVERRKERNLYLSGWRTGSAAWLYLTMIEWILGARAEYGGLRIDPNLPEGWKQAKLTRPFRGDTFAITIESDGKPGAAVQSITLDGEPIEGTLITPLGDGQRHEVAVILAAD